MSSIKYVNVTLSYAARKFKKKHTYIKRDAIRKESGASATVRFDDSMIECEITNYNYHQKSNTAHKKVAPKPQSLEDIQSRSPTRRPRGNVQKSA